MIFWQPKRIKNIQKKNMLGIRVPLSDYQESVCPNSRTCWLDDFCVDLSLRIVGGSYVKIPRHRTVAFLAVFRPQLNSSLSQPPIVSGNSFHVYFTDFLLVIGLSLITKMVGRDRLTEEHSWLSSLSISLQPWDIFSWDFLSIILPVLTFPKPWIPGSSHLLPSATTTIVTRWLFNLAGNW